MIKKLKQFRKTKMRHLFDLTFLYRCCIKEIASGDLKIKLHIYSGHAIRTYHRAGFAVIREQMHSTRSELDSISLTLFKLYLQLCKTLPPTSLTSTTEGHKTQ